jgi:Flp pilus assembly protein CpaB
VEPVARHGPFGLGRLGRRGGVRSRRAAYRVATFRRLVAALLAGVVVFVVLRALAPPPPVGLVPVVVSRHDVAAGAVLGSDDVEVAARDPTQVPAHAVTEPAAVVGQLVAGPIAAGEVLTTVRLRGGSLLAGQPPGVVAVGIPLADATVAREVRPGDRVTVHAVGAGSPVAQGVVLTVQTADASALTGQSGSVGVVLALTADETSALATAMGGPNPGFVLALRR